jgi:hypothetical protein
MMYTVCATVCTEEFTAPMVTAEEERHLPPAVQLWDMQRAPTDTEIDLLSTRLGLNKRASSTHKRTPITHR